MVEQPWSVENFNDVGQMLFQKVSLSNYIRCSLSNKFWGPISGAGILPRLKDGNNPKLVSHIKSMYHHNYGI